jgi:hypothetical protein
MEGTDSPAVADAIIGGDSSALAAIPPPVIPPPALPGHSVVDAILSKGVSPPKPPEKLP